MTDAAYRSAMIAAFVVAALWMYRKAIWDAFCGDLRKSHGIVFAMFFSLTVALLGATVGNILWRWFLS